MTDRFVCAQCGQPGIVEPGYSLIDPRYARGKCTGLHEGTQYLVREGVNYHVKVKPQRNSARKG